MQGEIANVILVKKLKKRKRLLQMPFKWIFPEQNVGNAENVQDKP